MVLEPIYERNFAAQSYGFRPGIGCKDALPRVDALLKAGYARRSCFAEQARPSYPSR
jgi:retron-type reverse transcriptase